MQINYNWLQSGLAPHDAGYMALRLMLAWKVPYKSRITFPRSLSPRFHQLNVEAIKEAMASRSVSSQQTNPTYLP